MKAEVKKFVKTEIILEMNKREAKNIVDLYNDAVFLQKKLRNIIKTDPETYMGNISLIDNTEEILENIREIIDQLKTVLAEAKSVNIEVETEK